MIRRAEPRDVPGIVAMGLRFAAESDYGSKLPVVPDVIARTVARVATSDEGLLLVSESEESLTGMIALVLYEHPFSGERFASELVWWVEPEARGVGVRLLRAAEEWARGSGAGRMQMIAPNERVGALYDRLGYSKLETTYQRSL